MAETLLSLPPDQFRAALGELQLGPEREADLMRQYRRANSAFAPVYGLLERMAAGDAGEGMARASMLPVARPEGMSVAEAMRSGQAQFAMPQGVMDAIGALLGGVDAPAAASQGLIPAQDMPMEALGAGGVAMGAGGLLSRPAGSVGMGGRVARDFDVSRRDASNIFGEGSERVRYTDPQSGGTMEIVVRPNGQASVLELEVPEQFRGQGIGQLLQARVMQDFPVMGGQVSSKAAATTAYRLGRRPYGQPDATLEDVFRMIDEDSSVNLISPAAQPTDLSTNRSTTTGLLASAASDTPAQRVARLLREGRADEVTDGLMAQVDPQEMYRLYEGGMTGADMPMDEASRMARAREMGFGADAYHSTSRDFPYFVPSEFRGASFFGPTPEGAQRGASASANEGVGAGSGAIIPAMVNTRRIEGIGSYSRRDQNEFRSGLEDRIYTEREVDDLMASDAAPMRGDWTYYFDDLTDYDALRAFREQNPDAPIPDGMIAFRPKQPIEYGPHLSSTRAVNMYGRQFSHYSDGMSERPISDYVRSQGNTGFSMLDESGLALGITDPTTIRSRFARFDPRLSHLANLSAANVSPITGLLSILAAQQGEQ